MNFEIRNARILTMDDDRRLLDGGLTVQDGEITSVGATESGTGLQIIDFEGDYLLPGLVQSHLHLCQTLFRHQAESRPLLLWLQERIWPLEAALDEDSLAVSARLGIAELLLGGTTCILDMGTVHHQDVLAETIQESGLRAVLGKAMMDAGDGVPSGLRETTRASLDESTRLAKRWHGAGRDRIRYALAPRFMLSCSRDLQEEVGRLSREHGYGIHTHSSEHADEVAEVERLMGARNVHVLEELGLCGPRTVFAHGVHLDDGERRVLAESRTTVCHCPSSNLKLGSGISDVVSLIQAGVNVGIGADGAPCNNSLDAFLEMRLAFLLQRPSHGPASMTALQVLEMATRNAARALGWEDRIGSLEPGKDADLIRLRRTDPRLGLGSDPYGEIVTAGSRDLVRDVWVRGRHLVAEGRLVDSDPAQLLQEGKAALRKTLDRAGLR